LIITSGTHIKRYFQKDTNIPDFSACHKAITLQADHIGEPAQPIEVHEFSPQASAIQAQPVIKPVSKKLCKVHTIAILYGTLSIKTDNNADHIVINNNNKLLFQSVIFTNLSANNKITPLCSSAHTTINKPPKKNNVA
jgi:hypothetical protein